MVALDARHTLNLLAAEPGAKVLDAGCGTGRNLARLRASGVRPFGLDFSFGMLRVASRNVPGIPLVQADLEAELPFRAGRFSAAVCALIGEHLQKLGFTLAQLYRSLQPGGTLIFSVYHPDLAEAGKEANFELDETEYRLGAIRYTVADYLQMVSDAGFRDPDHFEYKADRQLIDEIPSAEGLLNRRVILAIRARKPN